MKKAPYIEVTAPCGNQSFEEASSDSSKTPQKEHPSFSPNKRSQNPEVDYTELQAKMTANRAVMPSADFELNTAPK